MMRSYSDAMKLHAQRRYRERTGWPLYDSEYARLLAFARTAPVAATDPGGRDLVEINAKGLRLFAVLDRGMDRIVTFLPDIGFATPNDSPATAMSAAFARAAQKKSTGENGCQQP